MEGNLVTVGVMCFSATASFVASGGLTVIGIASFRVAHDKQRLLAGIPLLFGVQQGLEGLQWLAEDAARETIAPGYGFLFFAVLLWPTYIPLTVFMLDDRRKRLLQWLLGAGLVLTVYLLGVLLLEPLVVHVMKRSLHYEVDVPFNRVAASVYFAVVFGALILSSKRVFRLFGVALLLSAFAAATFFLTTFVSVWCFFAALLSSSLYFYLMYQKQHAQTELGAGG